MELILPKKRLSYSQISLWQKNKDQYRERYYLDGPSFENTETLFGKKIAKMLEDGVKDPVLDKVPRYQFMEHRIELKICGVPFLGVLDSFSKRRKEIVEYKTGRQPWDDMRVRRHDQLVIYSLLTKLKYGKVDPRVRLVWLETRYNSIIDKVGSREMEGEGKELEFTGKIQVFERRIAEWERTRMKNIIKKVAEEISLDYTLWLQNNNTKKS